MSQAPLSRVRPGVVSGRQARFGMAGTCGTANRPCFHNSLHSGRLSRSCVRCVHAFGRIGVLFAFILVGALIGFWLEGLGGSVFGASIGFLIGWGKRLSDRLAALETREVATGRIKEPDRAPAVQEPVSLQEAPAETPEPLTPEASPGPPRPPEETAPPARRYRTCAAEHAVERRRLDRPDLVHGDTGYRRHEGLDNERQRARQGRCCALVVRYGVLHS